MTITLLAHHIEWDTDGDYGIAQSLPSKLEVEVDLHELSDWHDLNQVICKQLSDTTGWCVLSYKLQGYNAEADFALQMQSATAQNQ